ncbi:MAG: PD-(D/E)XK nuclease family protein [Planctomycetaceae bacterium]
MPDVLASTVHAADALRLLLDAVATDFIPPRDNPASIDILGWLELPLHDARAVIVTSFNEGIVPSSLNADLFLPNSLRQRLGVLDNHRRYARDAYALTVLRHSRRRLEIILGKRNAAKDPLKPSRLLFAASDAVIADRIREFYGKSHGADASRPPLPTVLATELKEAAFTIPRPRPDVAIPKEISVTSFKAYLACPYRYYLTHVLRLRESGEGSGELDALQFGNLVHDSLAAFGSSTWAGSRDVDLIRAFLDEQLDKLVRQRFGKRPNATVKVQIEQARRRLRAFAPQQVHLAIEGWEIRHVEFPGENASVAFPLLDGREVLLSGRIDRIDFHPEHGWRLLDYKTSKEGQKPDKTHRTGLGKGAPKDAKEWIDLQLPLYRHIASGLGIEGEYSLGYFNLPEKLEETGLRLADWTEDDLTEADDKARQVAGLMLDRVFWPPSQDINESWSQRGIEAICQSSVFDGEHLITPNP